jgi:hypothetical protein
MNDESWGDPSRIPTVPGTYIDKDDDWLEKAWTSVPNELIRHPEIEWDARAAYAWLASHQTMRFRVTAQTLADAGPRGRNHAYTMIRELEKWGWVTRHRLRNPETGRTDIQVYKLHREPVAEERRTFKPSKATPEAPTKFITECIEADARKRQNPTSGSITERGVTERGVLPRQETEREGALARARCLDPLEDHLLTEEEHHTAALPREAALPQCVPEVPQMKVVGSSNPPTEPNSETAPFKVDSKTDQMKPDAQDSDPFAGQDGDPEQAGIDWSKRSRSSVKVADRWLKTKHSQESERLVDTYCETAMMPRESRNDLLPFVDKLLQQGITDEVLLRAIPACFKAKCGPTLLHRFVTQILHEDASVAGREATSTRNMNEQRANHNRWFRPDGSMRSPEEIAAMERGDQGGRLIVTGEVVRELPTG